MRLSNSAHVLIKLFDPWPFDNFNDAKLGFN